MMMDTYPADGNIDYVVIYDFDEDCLPVSEMEDMGNDGNIDTATYFTFDESGPYLKIEMDYDYNGTIDEYEMLYYYETDYNSDGKIHFSEGGDAYSNHKADHHWHTREIYYASGNLASVEKCTLDANGNCIRKEIDDNADGDMDDIVYMEYNANRDITRRETANYVEYRTYREDGTLEKMESDVSKNGDINSTFLYNSKGDPVSGVSTMSFGEGVISNQIEMDYIYDEYDNVIQNTTTHTTTDTMGNVTELTSIIYVEYVQCAGGDVADPVEPDDPEPAPTPTPTPDDGDGSDPVNPDDPEPSPTPTPTPDDGDGSDPVNPDEPEPAPTPTPEDGDGTDPQNPDEPDPAPAPTPTPDDGDGADPENPNEPEPAPTPTPDDGDGTDPADADSDDGGGGGTCFVDATSAGGGAAVFPTLAFLTLMGGILLRSRGQ
jgi:hypothetical protein